MKLSEMTNKDAFKAIAKILPVAKEIIKDESLLNIYLRKMNIDRNIEPMEYKRERTKFNIDKRSDLISYVLEHHDKSIFKILGILNNKKPSEIANQGFIETLGQLTEALNDEALVKLFTTSI